MIKALVLKELRESVGLMAVAALGAVYALFALTGTNLFPWQPSYVYQGWFPFVSDRSTFYLTLIGGGLAVGLGLKQAAWELGFSTYYFLLHRPIDRMRVFATKLAVGVASVLLLSALAILAYAWWAATPGQHAAPFFWSMTYPIWKTWCVLPLVYLGAFLSGIRPGHWFGTRLLPLVTAGGLAAFADTMPWGWLTLLLVALGSAVLLTAIFYYVRHRDF